MKYPNKSTANDRDVPVAPVPTLQKTDAEAAVTTESPTRTNPKLIGGAVNPVIADEAKMLFVPATFPIPREGPIVIVVAERIRTTADVTTKVFPAGTVKRDVFAMTFPSTVVVDRRRGVPTLGAEANGSN